MHQLTHLEPRHKCSYPNCNYRSATIGNMNRHMAIHERQLGVRIQCVYGPCTYTTTNSGEMTLHVKTARGQDRARMATRPRRVPTAGLASTAPGGAANGTDGQALAAVAAVDHGGGRRRDGPNAAPPRHAARTSCPALPLRPCPTTRP